MRRRVVPDAADAIVVLVEEPVDDRDASDPPDAGRAVMGALRSTSGLGSHHAEAPGETGTEMALRWHRAMDRLGHIQTLRVAR